MKYYQSQKNQADTLDFGIKIFMVIFAPMYTLCSLIVVVFKRWDIYD